MPITSSEPVPANETDDGLKVIACAADWATEQVRLVPSSVLEAKVIVADLLDDVFVPMPTATVALPVPDEGSTEHQL